MFTSCHKNCRKRRSLIDTLESLMTSAQMYLKSACLFILTLNLSACFAPLPEDLGMGGDDRPGAGAECRFNSDCELCLLYTSDAADE